MWGKGLTALSDFHDHKAQDEASLAAKSLDWCNKSQRETMMHKATHDEELKRVEAMSTLEAVAFANRLSNRLKCDDCSDEERMNGLELLRRLGERVQFLKITLEPQNFCRIGWNYFAESGGASK